VDDSLKHIFKNIGFSLLTWYQSVPDLRGALLPHKNVSVEGLIGPLKLSDVKKYSWTFQQRLR